MNWTGGRLSRHSRNNNGREIQRQKLHFAKARCSLPNVPSKRSLTRCSIFDEVEGGERSRLPATLHTARYRPQDPPEDNPNAHGGSQKRRRSESSPNSALPKYTRQSDEKPTVARKHDSQRSAGYEVGCDIHSEEQTPLYTENAYHQLSDEETAGNTILDDRVDSLEERRRRILRRIDWVGANIQHPIKLRFTASGNDRRLGKRRKITARHQSQFGAIAQSMVTSPFLKSRFERKMQDSSEGQNSNISINIGGLPKNHVRISIGGRHVVAGAGSSTSQSKNFGKDLVSPGASTSDVMLLDGEDIIRQSLLGRLEKSSHPSFSPSAPPSIGENGSLIPSPATNPPVRTPHRQEILPPFNKSIEATDRLSAATFDGLEGINRTTWNERDGPTLNVTPQFEGSANDLFGPTDRQIPLLANPHPNLATLRTVGVETFLGLPSTKYAKANQALIMKTASEISSPLAGYITDVSTQLSLSARKLQSVARDKSRRIASIGSHPDILHPMPLSLRKSQVLRSISSELAGSTAAQIGVAEPVATTSQMLDEEIWKTWVLSSENDHVVEEPRNEEGVAIYISPGISNHKHQSALTDPKEQRRRDSKDLLDYQDMSLDINSYNRPMRDSRPRGHAEVGGQDSRTSTKQTDRKSINNEQILSKEKVLDYKNLFSLRPKNTLSPPPISARVENPDEAWMKFILSDDEDDNEDYILNNLDRQNARSPAPTQNLPDSSLIAHPSTETISSPPPHRHTISRTHPTDTPERQSQDLTISSTEGHHTSNHTTLGSNQLSEPSPPQTQSDPEPEPNPYPASPSMVNITRRVNRRLTFTKTPRFITSTRTRSDSPDAVATAIKSPIHIGKGIFERGRRERLTRMERATRGWEARDIYSLDSADDDVESIEDD